MTSKNREAPKVEGYTNVVKETTGFLRQNSLNGIKLPLSLWEDNLKVLALSLNSGISFKRITSML
jgi:hypothetical protein